MCSTTTSTTRCSTGRRTGGVAADVRLPRRRPVGGAVPFDLEKIVRSRDQSDLLESATIQDLVADRSLEAADAYRAAINVQVDAGLAVGVFGAETGKSAQMFHSDRDHLRFVKFFAHLSDVTSQSGPHVRGSHADLSRCDGTCGTGRRCRRTTAEDIVEICGREAPSSQSTRAGSTRESCRKRASGGSSYPRPGSTRSGRR
jgi:hypothetical protein